MKTISTNTFYLLSVIAFSVIFSGCTEKREYAVTDVDINGIVNEVVKATAGNEKLTIDRSKNFFDHRIVKLETNDNCLIAEISQLQCDRDSNFYILDKSTKSLFMFNKVGKFIFKINRVGKGPGEYIDISNFCLADDHVVLFDNKSQTLFFYTLKGEFVRAITTRDLNLYPTNVAYLGNSVFALAQDKMGSRAPSPARLVLFNVETQKVVNAYLPSEVSSDFGQEFYFYNSNNTVLFKPLFENYVIQLKPNTLERGIYFDFGKHNYPEGFAASNQFISYEEVNKLNCVSNIFNIIYTKDMLSFSYHFGDYWYLNWYSFKSKKVYGTINSGSKRVVLFERPLASLGDYFIGKLTPMGLININKGISTFNEEDMETYENETLPENFKTILKEVDENDNPYLLLYKVQE